MKHEHNVCTRRETSPSIEAAPCAVFTQYPASPSALPSSALPGEHGAVTGSTAAKAAWPPQPASHESCCTGCATELQLPLHTFGGAAAHGQGTQTPTSLLPVPPCISSSADPPAFSGKTKVNCTMCTLPSQSQIPSSPVLCVRLQSKGKVCTCTHVLPCTI